MKCDNCRFQWCEGASVDYPYPWTSCSKGHWDGDPGPERARTKQDEEVDLWADCPDYERKQINLKTMRNIETSYTGSADEPILTRYGFKGTSGSWATDDWGLGVQQVVDEYNNKWESRTFHIHAGKGGSIIGSVNYSTAVGGYANISSHDEAEANARLVSAAPDILSDLLQACSACECYMRLNNEIEAPEWYTRAKQHIENIINPHP